MGTLRDPTTKRWIFQAVVDLAFVAVILAGLFVFVFINASNETQFSTGFSYLAFREIESGMSESEVLDLVGKPLEVDYVPYHGIRWVYSDRVPGHHGDYLRFWVWYNDDSVTEVNASYYVD